MTGAAGGIGLAAARAFADAGMRVVSVDRPGEALQNAGDLLLWESWRNKNIS